MPMPSEPRALVVDDVTVNRRVLSLMLKNLGWQTAECADAAGTLSLVRDKQPHLILLDLSLGDGDGIELCRQLRSALPDPAVKIVAYTAQAFLDDDNAFQSAGFDGVLTKPVNLDTVRRLLRQIGFA